MPSQILITWLSQLIEWKALAIVWDEHFIQHLILTYGFRYFYPFVACNSDISLIVGPFKVDRKRPLLGSSCESFRFCTTKRYVMPQENPYSLCPLYKHLNRFPYISVSHIFTPNCIGKIQLSTNGTHKSPLETTDSFGVCFKCIKLLFSIAINVV